MEARPLEHFSTGSHGVNAKESRIAELEPEAEYLAQQVIVAPVHEDKFAGGSKTPVKFLEAIQRLAEVVKAVGAHDDIEMAIRDRQAGGFTFNPGQVSGNVFSLGLDEHLGAQVYPGDVQSGPLSNHPPF
jgi:hypothetical protein